jgi:NodT family efflux transporter outer membrane factor (OMF) lipoprotein
MLLSLIDQALAGNRELRMLDEEVQIARNEVQARRGAYLPFVMFRTGVGLEKPSLYTPLGTVEDQLEPRPGLPFPEPLPNYLGVFNLFWQLDIWRELRNARDAAIQRYAAATEQRNFYVTRLIAEVAENYYGLVALDKRLENLEQIIELQENSYKIAKSKMEAGRGTDLAVQRFLAEVRKNQSELLIVKQDMLQLESRINFLVNRFPQPVERRPVDYAGFLDLNIQLVNIGVPAQLLQNRPDIRQAERELEAAGLDVRVARAHFFPRVDLTAGVGYEAFQPRFLFTPESLIYSVAGNLVAPVVNKTAIRAEYRSANAAQLQSVYNYQRAVLNAFTEVVNRISKIENFSQSIERKKQRVSSLEAAVESASKLFQAARVEYIEVLLAQRDLQEARAVLIDTKREQLSAIVNAYQALGGGWQDFDAAHHQRVQPRCSPTPDLLPQLASPPWNEELPSPRLVPEQSDK